MCIRLRIFGELTGVFSLSSCKALSKECLNRLWEEVDFRKDLLVSRGKFKSVLLLCELSLLCMCESASILSVSMCLCVSVSMFVSMCVSLSLYLSEAEHDTVRVTP